MLRSRFVVGVVTVLLVIGGCTTTEPAGDTSGEVPPAPTTTDGAEGEPTSDLAVLTIGVAQEPQTFDPNVNVAAVSAYRYYGNVYEGLVRYAPDGTIEPLLATDWEISDDGLTYRFNLRDDVLFSDGTPFNAEAVEFAIERLRALEVGAVAFFEPISEVTVVDEFTVEFGLEQPFAPLMAILAGWQGAIFVSPTTVEENTVDDDFAGAYLTDHTAGTGPFVLETWEPNSRVVLTRNPHFRTPPTEDSIGTVVYVAVGEAATLRQLVLAGEIDIAEELTPSILGPVQEAGTVNVGIDVSYAGYGTHVYFNLTRGPFDDPNLRRAVAYALDYERLIEVWQGTGQQGQGFLPEDFEPWFSPENVVVYTQDLAAAEEQLAASGHSMPIDPPLTVELIWQSGNTAQRDMAQLMQEDLAALGINIEVVEREIPQWRDAIWTKEFDMAFFGLPLRYGDPDSVPALSFVSTEVRDRGFNPGIIDEDIDRLTAEGRTQLDLDARVAAYHEMQAIITEEVYFLPLIERSHAWAHSQDLTGIVWNPFYGQIFHAAEISKVSG